MHFGPCQMSIGLDSHSYILFDVAVIFLAVAQGDRAHTHTSAQYTIYFNLTQCTFSTVHLALRRNGRKFWTSTLSSSCQEGLVHSLNAIAGTYAMEPCDSWRAELCGRSQGVGIDTVHQLIVWCGLFQFYLCVHRHYDGSATKGGEQ